MPKFDTSELTAFGKKLEGVAKQIDRVAIKVTSNSASRMLADAKREVRKDTGKLARDLRIIKKGNFGPNQVGAEFGVDSAERGLVGIVIEKGFKHWRSGTFVGPFPYLEPAEAKHHSQWVARLRQAAAALIVR